MSISFEHVNKDQGSSFRVLHHKVLSEQYTWIYHYHPEIEIVFVKNGEGRRHVGNHISYYSEGDLVLIGSNLPHSGFGFGSKDIHEEIVVQFLPDFCGSLINISPELKKVKKILGLAQQGISFSSEVHKEIEPLMYRLVELKNNNLRLMVLLEVLLKLSEIEDFKVLNAAGNTYSHSTKNQKRLLNIFEFVKKNYKNKIPLEEIASEANLTVPAFCNYFKKQTDISFSDYVNQFRVNIACSLLVTKRDINEIAHEVGFSSLPYFSRIFKKYKGMSPLKYQQKIVN